MDDYTHIATFVTGEFLTMDLCHKCTKAFDRLHNIKTRPMSVSNITGARVTYKPRKRFEP